MKKFIQFLVISAVMTAAAFTPLVTNANDEKIGFTDVPKEHWAYEYITEMTETGILSGYGGGDFRPENPVTRAEFAKMLAAAYNLDVKPVAASSFFDVVPYEWYVNYIVAAQEYFSGTVENGKNVFEPGGLATREAVSVALVKVIGFDVSGVDTKVLRNYFKDYDSFETAFRPYVALAVKNGIINGYPDKFFFPKNGLSRAEAAVVLYRALNTENTVKEPFVISEELKQAAVDANVYFRSENTARDQMKSGYIKRWTGSGAVIDKNGTILTNNHVIENNDNLDLTFSKGHFNGDVRILGYSVEYDIALVKVIGQSGSYGIAELDYGYAPGVGDGIYTVGNPEGEANVYSQGEITRVGIGVEKYIHKDDMFSPSEVRYRLSEGEGGHLIEAMIDISGGSSGGGVYNKDGRLIGIISMGLENSVYSHGYYVPISYINGLPEVNYSVNQYKDAVRRAKALKEKLDSFSAKYKNGDVTASKINKILVSRETNLLTDAAVIFVSADISGIEKEDAEELFNDIFDNVFPTVYYKKLTVNLVDENSVLPFGEVYLSENGEYVMRQNDGGEAPLDAVYAAVKTKNKTIGS
jgi:S1-C subfamily serine protease